MKKYFNLFCISKNVFTFVKRKHKNKTMKTTFTSTERVLFNANLKFWIQNGLSEAEATEKAMNKILQKRLLSKKLTFKF